MTIVQRAANGILSSAPPPPVHVRACKVRLCILNLFSVTCEERKSSWAFPPRDLFWQNVHIYNSRHGFSSHFPPKNLTRRLSMATLEQQKHRVAKIQCKVTGNTKDQHYHLPLVSPLAGKRWGTVTQALSDKLPDLPHMLVPTLWLCCNGNHHGQEDLWSLSRDNLCICVTLRRTEQRFQSQPLEIIQS